MDLKAVSGLALQMDGAGKLYFDPGVVIDEYRQRVLDELTLVYLDTQACKGKQVAYEMFNGVFADRDRARLRDLPVRYELTLFPEMKVGREYVKTLGHIHAPEMRTGIDPAEICEVVVGRAHFFFMKLNPDGTGAGEAFFVEVRAGEKIIIPPGYDHLTINPGPGPLLFADVVSRTLQGNYERMKAAHGAVYLEVEENGSPVFIPNPAYRAHPPLRQLHVKVLPSMRLTTDQALYTTFVETGAQEWQFLWQPELYKDRFPTVDAIFNPPS